MHTQTQTIQHLLSATESLLSAVRAIADQEKAVMTPVAAPLDLAPSENPVASIEPAPSIGGKRMFTAHQYLRDVYGVTNPKLRRLTTACPLLPVATRRAPALPPAATKWERRCAPLTSSSACCP
jgi:hypothetical protein